MKHVLMLLMISALAGCGGYHKARRDVAPAPRPATLPAPIAITPTVVGITTPQVSTAVAVPPPPVVKPFATGPIQSACTASDRKARSRDLCGCIQAVADDTLSTAQQRLAVSFYKDPQKAQDIRQSDSSAHKEFWEAYRAYGERAERMCA